MVFLLSNRLSEKSLTEKKIWKQKDHLMRGKGGTTDKSCLAAAAENLD